MKEFFVDYVDMVWKPSWTWANKHWKGYLLMCFAPTLTWLAWFYKDEFVDKIENLKAKFRKEEG